MAVGCMILILAFRLLAELMLDGSSQFFMYFIYFLHVLAGLFAALLYFILGVIRLIQKRSGGWKRMALCGGLAFTVLLSVFVPVQQLVAEIKHQMYAHQRQEVVEQIINGQLREERNGDIQLPEALKYISLDGEVRVYERRPERSVIGFYASKGLTDTVSATVYCSDGRMPDEEVLNTGAVFLCKRLEENWYYVTYD